MKSKKISIFNYEKEKNELQRKPRQEHCKLKFERKKRMKKGEK
jgi:hypothetical protein